MRRKGTYVYDLYGKRVYKGDHVRIRSVGDYTAKKWNGPVYLVTWVGDGGPGMEVQATPIGREGGLTVGSGEVALVNKEGKIVGKPGR